MFLVIRVKLTSDNAANVSVPLLDTEHRGTDTQRGADCPLCCREGRQTITQCDILSSLTTHTETISQPSWISTITSGPVLSKSPPYFFLLVTEWMRKTIRQHKPLCVFCTHACMLPRVSLLMWCCVRVIPRCWIQRASWTIAACQQQLALLYCRAETKRKSRKQNVSQPLRNDTAAQWNHHKGRCCVKITRDRAAVCVFLLFFQWKLFVC